MGAIAINAAGDIGLAYNVSSGSVFPSIRYTGRLASDPLGQMTFAETSIVAGSSRNGSNRYGDYNSLDVDPVTGDFWGTAKYNTNIAWSTRIFRFSLGVPECFPPIATATATCEDLTEFTVNVDITSIGSAGSITIQIDPDGNGPLPAGTVGTANAAGNFGPFGPYASGTSPKVLLLHDAFPSCNISLLGIGATCTDPGQACTTFTSTAPTAIVDNTTVTNTITVPAQSGATLTDLKVYVDITHTWVADLRIGLESPTGTVVPLIAAAKCGNADDIQVEFDDAAAEAVGDVCPMLQLFVVPDNALSAFDGEAFEGDWTLSVQDVATQDQGTLNSWCLIPTLNTPLVQLSPKVFLEGPLNGAGTLMGDALRSQGLVPLTEPYTVLGYSFVGSVASSISADVLTTTGNDAIVDWVIVELRDNSTPATIVASMPALVQRDGDVVAVDGTSALGIAVPNGTYRVAIRHRNHLGAMTANGVALSGSAATVDLTSAATATFGTDARKTVGSSRALWSGDVTFDHTLLYTGNGNDRDLILQAIGGTVPTNTLNGEYRQEDVNLDGTVRYTGGANDRDPILSNIGGVVPTATRVEQLP